MRLLAIASSIVIWDNRLGASKGLTKRVRWSKLNPHLWLARNCTALPAVDISNLFRSHTLYHQSCDAPTDQVNWLEATFRKIFQDIFSSFEFGSELDPKNTGLLGVVECDHNYGLAFNLDESGLNFMREQWRWRKRVGSIDYVPETSAMPENI